MSQSITLPNSSSRAADYLPAALPPSPPERARVAAAKGGNRGLVSSCISGRGGSLAPVPPSPRSVPLVAVYADSVSARSGVKLPPGPGGRRAACRGFSSASRRRLIREMSRVRVGALQGYFVTLTYPSVWSDDWRRWKRDLASWRKRLLRKWPQIAGGVWRVEFQRRGAPHYHLIVWVSAPLPPAFKLWLSRSWYEVVGSGDVKHLRAGTQLQALDSRRAVRLYVSKYVAKNANTVAPEAWGRNWGFFGQVDREEVIDYELTREEYVLLRRIVRKWLKSRNSHKYARYLSYAERMDVLALGVDSLTGAERAPPPTILLMLDAVRELVGEPPLFIEVWEMKQAHRVPPA